MKIVADPTLSGSTDFGELVFGRGKPIGQFGDPDRSAAVGSRKGHLTKALHNLTVVSTPLDWHPARPVVSTADCFTWGWGAPR